MESKWELIHSINKADLFSDPYAGYMIKITVDVKVLTDSSRPMFAARILDLGLTAYDRNEHDALMKLDKLYKSWVGAHMEIGTLEKCLNLSGLLWCWVNENNLIGEKNEIYC